MASWNKEYSRYRDFSLNVLRVYKDRPDVRASLEIALSLMAIIIFSAFAVRPTILTILELNKEIGYKEDVVVKLNQKINNLQTASLILQNQGSKINFILQSVPPLANPDVLVRQFEGYAQANSVTLLGISASDVILKGQVDLKKSKESKPLPESAGEIPVTLSVTGSYTNLLSYLKNLERLRRPIKVDSFSINSSQTEEGQVLVMVITARVPFLSSNNNL